MEVAEHDIRAPPTDKLDDAGVDPATKKGHSATGTARASGDIVGIETKLGAKIAAEVRIVWVTSREETVHHAVVVSLRTAHKGASEGAPWRRR
jgi:hypothetical protein